MLIGRPPTRREQAWLDKCAQVPCIVCYVFHGIPDTPAEIHHLDGKTKPDAHLRTISLCKRHHRTPDDAPKKWMSWHGDGRRAFEKRYASADELYEIQCKAVADLERRMV